MTHNPPSHRARSEIMTKMKKLHHCKGPTWIHHFGHDVNLAGTRAQSRVKNNRLIDTLGLQESDDDEVQLVAKPAAKKSASKSAMKPSNKKSAAKKESSLEKVERMRNCCKQSINFSKDFDDLDEEEKKKQRKSMRAITWYSKTIREERCDDVTGMLIDRDEELDQGHSQGMHQQIMNTQAYEY